MRPSKTLFVIDFDAESTRTRDLARHFEPYGEIVDVRITRNFAFVQYESQEDATRALDATNMSKLMDRMISVEYAVKGFDVRGSLDYGRGSSPGGAHRKGRGRGPDYGRGRSPSPLKRGSSCSPDYGCRGSGSPHGRGRDRSPYKGEEVGPKSGDGRGRESSPRNGHGGDSRKPLGRERGRGSPESG